MNVDALAQKYVEVYGDCDKQQASMAFTAYPDNVCSNDAMGIMFVRLSDVKFQVLKNNPEYLASPEFLADCYQDKGENIHLLKAFGDIKGFRPLVRELIAQSPKTISYYRDDLERLHLIYQREK